MHCIDSSYKNTFVALIVVHCIQALAAILIAFIVQIIYVSILVCFACISIVPFCFFIGIAISTGVTHGCQTMMKTWLITDCIVFAISQFYFIFFAAKMHCKKTE